MSTEDVNIELIKELLEIPITTRTLENINKLMSLTKSLPFVQSDLMIQEKGERAHQLCCQYMTYLYAEKDENLFQLGEKGQYFYLVLQGSVGMYIQKKDPITGEVDPYTLEKIKHIPQGQAFGELSLISGKPAICVAKCESNSHFAILNKNRYKNLLAIGGIKYLLSEIGFFSSLPYSDTFTSKLVKLLFLQQDIITFHRGQVVYEEGNSVDYVYLVKFGEFNKTQKVINQPEEIESYWQLPQDEICVNQRKVVTSKVPPKESTVQIGIILQKDLIGDLEVLRNLKKRLFTLTCYSHEGQLIRISRKDFEEQLLTEESDKKYLLNRAVKIQKMEEILKHKNQNGALFNHFFSFENVYKQNRVQSKSNVLDDSNPNTPSSNRHSENNKIVRQVPSIFTGRQNSIHADSVSSPSANGLLLSKKNSVSTPISIPHSSLRLQSSIFSPVLDQKQMSEEKQLQSKDNRKLNLSLIKIQTAHNLSQNKNDSQYLIQSPLKDLQNSPKKLKLKLKLKTEQYLDKYDNSLQDQLQSKTQSIMQIQKDEDDPSKSDNALKDNTPNSEDQSQIRTPQKINFSFKKRQLSTDQSSNQMEINQESNNLQTKQQSEYKLTQLAPIIKQNHKNYTQNDDYFPQKNITNQYSNSQYLISSPIKINNDQQSKEMIFKINQKNKMNTEQIQNEADQNTQSNQIKNNQAQIKYQRNDKKNKTQGHQHVDPFVQMFHKRLQYNYFQQYGKVDMQHLKGHIKNDTLKLLPEFEANTPSLTDIRLLTDEYLFNKNKQDIKKINQMFIKSSSNLKPINNMSSTSQGFSTLSNFSNLNKTSEGEILSSIQTPTKFFSNQINSARNFNENARFSEQIENPKLIEQIEKSRFTEYIENPKSFINQQNYSDHKLDESEKQRFEQVSQKFTNLQQLKNTTSQILLKPIQEFNNKSANNLYSSQQISKVQSPNNEKPNLNEYELNDRNANKIQNNDNGKFSKTDQNFNKKLEYLKQITRDPKKERIINQQFLNLNKTPSISIKSFTTLTERESLKNQSQSRKELNSLISNSKDQQYKVMSTQNIQSDRNTDQIKQPKQINTNNFLEDINQKNKTQTGYFSQRNINESVSTKNELQQSGRVSTLVFDDQYDSKSKFQLDSLKMLEDGKKKKQRVIKI